jgi:hypothetical protein
MQGTACSGSCTIKWVGPSTPPKTVFPATSFIVIVRVSPLMVGEGKVSASEGRQAVTGSPGTPSRLVTAKCQPMLGCPAVKHYGV